MEYTLVVAIFVINIQVVTPACTFPSPFANSNWTDSDKGLLQFTNSTMTGWDLLPVTEWECRLVEGDSENMRLVVEGNAIVRPFGLDGKAFLCMKITKITDNSYAYLLEWGQQTQTIGQSALQRVTVLISANLTGNETFTDYCLDSSHANYPEFQEYHVLVQEGYENKTNIECPSTFFGVYSYEVIDEFLVTYCGSGDESWDVCTDYSRMSISNSSCNQTVLYAANGSLFCLHSVTAGSYTAIILYNDGDETVDETDTYRFTCLMSSINSDGSLFVSQTPGSCKKGQTPTDQPTILTQVVGLNLNLQPTTKTDEDEPSTGLSAGAIVGIVLGTLIFLASVAAIILLCLFKKCRLPKLKAPKLKTPVCSPREKKSSIDIDDLDQESIFKSEDRPKSTAPRDTKFTGDNRISKSPLPDQKYNPFSVSLLENGTNKRNEVIPDSPTKTAPQTQRPKYPTPTQPKQNALSQHNVLLTQFNQNASQRESYPLTQSTPSSVPAQPTQNTLPKQSDQLTQPMPKVSPTQLTQKTLPTPSSTPAQNIPQTHDFQDTVTSLHSSTAPRKTRDDTSPFKRPTSEDLRIDLPVDMPNITISKTNEVNTGRLSIHELESPRTLENQFSGGTSIHPSGDLSNLNDAIGPRKEKMLKVPRVTNQTIYNNSDQEIQSKNGEINRREDALFHGIDETQIPSSTLNATHTPRKKSRLRPSSKASTKSKSSKSAKNKKPSTPKTKRKKALLPFLKSKASVAPVNKTGTFYNDDVPKTVSQEANLNKSDLSETKSGIYYDDDDEKARAKCFWNADSANNSVEYDPNDTRDIMQTLGMVDTEITDKFYNNMPNHQNVIDAPHIDLQHERNSSRLSASTDLSIRGSVSTRTLSAISSRIDSRWANNFIENESASIAISVKPINLIEEADIDEENENTEDNTGTGSEEDEEEDEQVEDPVHAEFSDKKEDVRTTMSVLYGRAGEEEDDPDRMVLSGYSPGLMTIRE